jgi:Fur family ferric uptake transcriptional regulator
MNNPQNTIQQMLQKSGLRATSQRKTILEVVTQHRGPLTAEDIYRQAQKLNPRISLATVYRTLTALKDAGVLDQRYLTREHDRSHFELADASERFHFHCLKCGKIIEFQSHRILSLLRKELADQYRATVTEACLCSDGYCEKCSNSLTNS